MLLLLWRLRKLWLYVNIKNNCQLAPEEWKREKRPMILTVCVDRAIDYCRLCDHVCRDLVVVVGKGIRREASVGGHVFRVRI